MADHLAAGKITPSRFYTKPCAPLQSCMKIPPQKERKPYYRHIPHTALFPNILMTATTLNPPPISGKIKAIYKV